MKPSNQIGSQLMQQVADEVGSIRSFQPEQQNMQGPGRESLKKRDPKIMTMMDLIDPR